MCRLVRALFVLAGCGGAGCGGRCRGVAGWFEGWGVGVGVNGDLVLARKGFLGRRFRGWDTACGVWGQGGVWGDLVWRGRPGAISCMYIHSKPGQAAGGMCMHVITYE